MCSFDIIEIPFDTSLPIVEEVYICRLIFLFQNNLQNFDTFLKTKTKICDTFVILIKKTKDFTCFINFILSVPMNKEIQGRRELYLILSGNIGNLIITKAK